MAEPFQEDFFERIVNVNWETEAKVLWLAGTGNPFFVNGLNFSAYLKQLVYSSSDGFHWNTFDYGLHSTTAPNRYAMGPIFTGGWMRQDLLPGNQPVWILGGSDARFGGMGDAAFSSLDGTYIKNEQNFDDYATMDGYIAISKFPGPPDAFNPRGTPGEILMEAFGTLRGYQTLFFSTDGVKWRPPNYFGGVTPLAAEGAIEINSGHVAVFITTPEKDKEATMAALTARLHDPLPDTMRVAAPFSSVPFSSTPSTADNIVFIPCTNKAIGRVRKGPFQKFKQIGVVIDPFNFRSPAHGGPQLSVYSIDPQQGTKFLTHVNCGITRTISVAYGYYTWCVGGQVIKGNQGYSVIASSRDLVHWVKTVNVPGDQVNAFAVGPLKGALDPGAPIGTNPSPI